MPPSTSSVNTDCEYTGRSKFPGLQTDIDSNHSSEFLCGHNIRHPKDPYLVHSRNCSVRNPDLQCLNIRVTDDRPFVKPCNFCQKSKKKQIESLEALTYHPNLQDKQSIIKILKFWVLPYLDGEGLKELLITLHNTINTFHGYGVIEMPSVKIGAAQEVLVDGALEATASSVATTVQKAVDTIQQAKNEGRLDDFYDRFIGQEAKEIIATAAVQKPSAKDQEADDLVTDNDWEIVEDDWEMVEKSSS